MPVVTATVFRESLDTKLGLSLRQMDDRIMITGKSPDGLFVNTDLKVGMALVSMNGELCRTMDSKAAIAFLKAVQGDLTVTAEHVGYVSATVTKTESPSIGMAVKARGGQLYITRICDDGLFTDTDLKVGMCIVSVNKKSCAGLRTRAAVALFKNTEETELVVLAKDPGYVTAKVTKESADTKCGISLKEMDESIYLSHVDPKGLFAETDLDVGLRLVRVNHREMNGRSATEALDVFKQAEGTLMVYAENAGFYNVTAIKDEPNDKVGIKLRSQGHNIFISSFAPDSLFAKTELKEGFRVISINGNFCRGLTPIQAIQFFIEAEREVTIFAEDTVKTGVDGLKGQC